MRRLGAAGIDPHMHADGDGAVRLALDAIEVLRREFPGQDIRPAIAHAEIVDPADYTRFARLGALPVLSFQWGKPAPDTIEGARDFLGPLRYAILEPQGLLELYGARIVFGSDWPVDPLDEWFALQVAVTRSAAAKDAQQYPGRLGIDPGLSLLSALRAMTLNGAYSLRLDQDTGSLETGKFADLIVLDRNLLTTPPAELARTRVLITMVGGRVVHRADP
jgi:predicted amidohydrolase YtcJ